MTNWTKFLVGIALLTFAATNLPAQSIFATLTGVVSDPSGAVVPNAKVKLKSEATGSLRDTVTNSDGYFSFSSLAVGDFTYELSVEAQGFVSYKASGLALGGGEKRNVNVTLQVGATTETIEVTAGAEALTTVDSGEKSATLTTKELQNFVQVGSNAAEYIKIMPGFAIQNGTSNRANYDGQVIGINANGDAGSQSPLNDAFRYNGLPSNSLDITADGAHVSDPGCNCDTPVNPNSDMIAEFKVQTSNFSAESQKGPIVASSVAKWGGNEFHGSAFFYARNYTLNANDALFNATSQPQPQNKYYYPGGTIGGPVLIPGTRFNKDRNKLFFFTGFEYFYQVLDTGLLRATVPTPGMLGGNFSPSEIAKTGPFTASGGPPGQLNAAAQALFPGGIIPSSQVDPNMVALMKLYPAANATPTQSEPYNYIQAETFNQNNTQWMSRVDYNISDNTKLFVRYNLQRETQQFPVGLWWRNGNQVPYPTPVLGKNRSDSVTASLTHVFSATMTNEFVFGYTFIGFPNVFKDPKKVDRAAVGYGYQGLYKNGVAQIPSFGSWGGAEAALIFNPGGFEAGGPTSGLYANKYMPSVSDTVSKVWGTHTVKAGFFWEWIRNAQPANNYTNGIMTVGPWNANSYGNLFADLVTGNISDGYTETSFNRLNDIAYNTYEGFVQDSWKVNRRLTLELGLRMTHFQPWVDRLGFGYSIFDYSKYSSSCLPTDYCGFLWNKRDPNVPLGGFPTRSLFYQPRLGLAYDLTGSGKTVIRGGWGRYYFHSGQFTAGLDVAAGVQTVTVNTGTIGGAHLFAKNLDSLNFSSAALSPAAVDSKDDRQAYTDNYNFTISRRLPWSSLVEVAYVGNQTHDIAGNYRNINLVPVGALLSSNNGGVDPASLDANKFRPLLGFSDLNLATNLAWANYNAFQATWVRTQGRYTINANYTYGKALGIVPGANSLLPDQFNLNNDYGVQPGNRKQIFNIAYSVELGNFTRNKIGGGVINGWQLSGITQVQSGANLTGFSSGANFNLNMNSLKIPGTTYNISNASLLGTTDIQLNPILTCDPTSGLGHNQYINPNCFAPPTQIGQNGPSVLPAIYGPAFFNWDLGLFKNFQISESKKLQFRVTGYNFLNHPLWSFNGTNLQAGFDGTTGKLNTPDFGTVTEKQGHRVIQLTVKFMF
ncbi:MAG TPA: carboxypeptidase-like regulatory domain-containing protein [Bryobacteraceae bacterium]|nr:carboxypeptidase-like regulatory domain-containing protein [Bryobacteraceae bacterium]